MIPLGYATLERLKKGERTKTFHFKYGKVRAYKKAEEIQVVLSRSGKFDNKKRAI